MYPTLDLSILQYIVINYNYYYVRSGEPDFARKRDYSGRPSVQAFFRARIREPPRRIRGKFVIPNSLHPLRTVNFFFPGTND